MYMLLTSIDVSQLIYMLLHLYISY